LRKAALFILDWVSQPAIEVCSVSLILHVCRSFFERTEQMARKSALLHKAPSGFSRAQDQRDVVLAGRIRFEALRTTELFETVWGTLNFPFFVPNF
jgi:hypothetical protein